MIDLAKDFDFLKLETAEYATGRRTSELIAYTDK